MATLPRREERSSQFLTDSFQRGLAHWNRERLAPGFPTADWAQELER
ncbi:MAG: iron-containing redox enzyme family protein, partial [Rhizorhabdus sp.]|nr:iron-containing redox enzyme family protein [Rhizorhabdus sp.]